MTGFGVGGPDYTRTYTVSLLPLGSIPQSVQWLQLYYECTKSEALEMYRGMKAGDTIVVSTDLWWRNESPVRLIDKAPRTCFNVEVTGSV